MRIHVASNSRAVSETLESLITASGHTPSTEHEAELILNDEIHPSGPLFSPAPRIALTATATHPSPEQILCPLRPQQFLSWLRARTQAVSTLPLVQGWQLQLGPRTLTHPEQESITLTEKEAGVLSALLLSDHHQIRREALLAKVWGITSQIDTHTLETHLYRLRQKLGQMILIDIVAEDGTYRLVTKA